jgi:hypothetical protein
MNIWNLLRRRQGDNVPTPYSMTSGVDFTGDDYNFTVPYRVKFSEHYTASKDIKHYCRRSRSSDGYKREAALKELVQHNLDTEAAAYVLVALGDYVIQISTLPLQATETAKKEMARLLKDSPSYGVYLNAVTISYWNEYYRDEYASYFEYPPYKFLQSLKTNSYS